MGPGQTWFRPSIRQVLWPIFRIPADLFGYRFEKTHTFEKIPDPVFPFDVRLKVAPLTSSFTRDTRDDPLDASRGRFTSHAFEWGLARLGSDLRYVKYYGQYFAYLPF